MTFHDWDGLTESRRFSDFVFQQSTFNPAKRKCPDCGYIMKHFIWTGLNMDKVGFAEFTCTNEDCHFHKNPIRIEPIPRKGGFVK